MTKIVKATNILNSCIGSRGVWADPTRYRHQCWTRDLVIAIMPVLLGTNPNIIKKHLTCLSKGQQKNGQIPILFLDNLLPFLTDKIKKSFKDKKLSFMLRRFLQGELWNLTPGTRDSEILFIMGIYEYTKATGDRSLLESNKMQIAKALAYIEVHLMRNNLVIGCDWRDTMEAELGNTSLLTNNCLLYRVYTLMGQAEKAAKLKAKIQEIFWKNNAFIDYPNNPRFDPLGGAFAVLFDVATIDQYSSLAKSFREVDSPCGVTIKCKHNPISPQEKEIIERTDGVVVWPFVVGFSVLALAKMGEQALAVEQFDKLRTLNGFREWYDPRDGTGCGALEQLWSATLFLRAEQALRTTEK